MIGPPGAGKTMLAKRLPTIIPPLTLEEALETTKIHSVAGKIDDHTALMTKRPFRSPHHTISDVNVIYSVENMYSYMKELFIFIINYLAGCSKLIFSC
jgi:predicted ATPase with chaperone activity